ncbi:DedA family protein [Alicyclobacillus fastidiosus]|uniref:DedA family protein n=1 Tax=Alicyclobacillus fastidiosus TaxID=392011 RepID=UPI0024E1033A|nr:DedA family protein [Alicyclobacillus fastidiosus]
MHIGVNHLLNQYGYFGVFCIFLTEMIGLPFPAETTLTLCGVEWSRGVFAFIPLWIMAACGNVIGSTIAYGVGSYLGHPVISRYGRFIGITAKRFQRAEGVFVKHQKGIVLFAKFVSGVRVLTPYLAGINRMKFIVFSFCNSISAFCWSAFYILEGRYLALLWHRYHYLVKHYEVLLLFLIFSVVVSGVWVRLKLRRRASRKSHRTSVEGPSD